MCKYGAAHAGGWETKTRTSQAGTVAATRIEADRSSFTKPKTDLLSPEISERESSRKRLTSTRVSEPPSGNQRTINYSAGGCQLAHMSCVSLGSEGAVGHNATGGCIERHCSSAVRRNRPPAMSSSARPKVRPSLRVSTETSPSRATTSVDYDFFERIPWT